MKSLQKSYGPKERWYLLMNKVFKNLIPNCFLLLVICYLLFLIRPAIFGQLGGTFRPHTIPQEYIQLEGFLHSQSQFSRTLWVPAAQRFGFYSYNHPAISGYDFFHATSSAGATNKLKEKDTERLLQESSVKYVIIPYDSEGEIFLKDRKYDNSLYEEAIDALRNITWLHEISGFGRIHVFEVSNPKDHFWLTSGRGSVSYMFKNPAEYVVSAKNVQKGEVLVFAESYDPMWTMQVTSNNQQETENTKQETSKQYHNRFNSFILPKSGSYMLLVAYQPQKWVNIGLWISALTLIVVFGILLFGFISKKW